MPASRAALYSGERAVHVAVVGDADRGLPVGAAAAARPRRSATHRRASSTRCADADGRTNQAAESASWGLRHPQLSPAPASVHMAVHSGRPQGPGDNYTAVIRRSARRAGRSPASAVSACGPRPVRQSAPVRRSASGGRAARPRAARTGPTTPRTPPPTARDRGRRTPRVRLPAAAHESGGAQHAQVLRHRGPADVRELRRERAGGHLVPVEQPFEDRPARRVGERAEDVSTS